MLLVNAESCAGAGSARIASQSLKRTIAKYGTTRKPCRMGAAASASRGTVPASLRADSNAIVLRPLADAPIQMKCRLCG